MNSNSKLPKNMTTCRWCHEPIMVRDNICKHCNDYQNDIDQEEFEKQLLNDSTLSVVDWFIILFFQIIGIGLGSIYIVNGEKIRGLKVLSYSIIIAIMNLTFFTINYSYYRYFIKLINTN